MLRRYTFKIWHAAVAVFLIIFIVMSNQLWYTIDEGEVGIETLYGEIVAKSGPGLHFKSPLNTVVKYTTRESRVQYGEFSSNGGATGGIAAYTKDQQSVVGAINITYRVTDPETLYRLYRTVENFEVQVLTPIVRQTWEVLFSKYSAVTVVANRGDLNTGFLKELQTAFEGKPINITSVQTVIQFSKDYEDAANKSSQLEIDLKSATRRLEIAKVDKESSIVKAQGEAESEYIKAEGAARAVEAKGLVDVKILKEKTQLIQQNSNLPALIMAEKWIGVAPTTLLMGGNANTLLNLPAQEKK